MSKLPNQKTILDQLYKRKLVTLGRMKIGMLSQWMEISELIQESVVKDMFSMSYIINSGSSEDAAALTKNSFRLAEYSLFSSAA